MDHITNTHDDTTPVINLAVAKTYATMHYTVAFRADEPTTIDPRYIEALTRGFDDDDHQ